METDGPASLTKKFLLTPIIWPEFPPLAMHFKSQGFLSVKEPLSKIGQSQYKMVLSKDL